MAGKVGSRTLGNWKNSKSALSTGYTAEQINWIEKEANFQEVPASIIIRKSIDVYRQLLDRQRRMVKNG